MTGAVRGRGQDRQVLGHGCCPIRNGGGTGAEWEACGPGPGGLANRGPIRRSGAGARARCQRACFNPNANRGTAYSKGKTSEGRSQ